MKFLSCSHRFAYVCYATGLMKEGLFLLHLLIILLILVMCVLTAFLQPFRWWWFVKCASVFDSETELDFSRYILSGKHYQDSLKGMICAKTNITQLIHDDQTQIELSNKPFLMLIILTSILLGFVSYYFIAALKQRLTLVKI